MGDIEDVQNTASGWFSGGCLSRVVGNVVSIDDVVVPVSLSWLKCGSLESECTFPAAGLGGSLVLGKRKLAGVVVPRAKKMDGLDTGGCAQRERELNSRHFRVS